MFTDKFSLDQINTLYDSVKELYISYRNKYDLCSKRRDELQSNVDELVKYVDSISSQKNRDSLVFSPRGVVNKEIYSIDKNLSNGIIDENYIINKKKELDELTNSLSVQESELSSLLSLVNIFQQNMNVLSSLKDSLSSVYNDEINEFYLFLQSGNKYFLSYFEKTFFEEISYLLYQKKMVDSFIDQDIVRAKQELSIMEKTLESLYNKKNYIEFILQPYPNQISLQKDLENLFSEIHDLYPESQIHYNIPDRCNIESFIKRIMIYILCKELFSEVFLSDPLSNICINIYYLNKDLYINFESDSKLFKLIIYKDNSITNILSKIIMLDKNYVIKDDKKYTLSIKIH